MHVAQSLVYPFRRGALGAWVAGLPLLVFFPVTFLVVLGYAVRAIREAARDPQAPPPSFHLDGRLVHDGFLAALGLALVAIPYAYLTALVAGPIAGRMPADIDPIVVRAESLLFGGFLVAIPWGTLVLIAGPPGLAAFAITGRARDLFDVVRAVRLVRDHFTAWNLATVAIVSAWILALAGIGLCCVGLLPGAFYAILVSAHATASLVNIQPTSAATGAPAASPR